VPDVGFGVYDECPADVTSSMSEGCLRLNQLCVILFAVFVVYHAVVRVLAVVGEHRLYHDAEEKVHRTVHCALLTPTPLQRALSTPTPTAP